MGVHAHMVAAAMIAASEATRTYMVATVRHGVVTSVARGLPWKAAQRLRSDLEAQGLCVEVYRE